MLRGHVFSEQIFGVDIFALFINQFLGGHNGIIESYKNAMEMTNTSNSITIKNGVAVIQGRYVEEHTETVLSYAKTDSLYCSLVIEIDLGKTNTKTSLEQVQYKILEGQNSYPTLTQNDIANQEGNIYQFELARFQNGATGIINFTDRRNYLSFDSVYSGIIQDNLNSDSSTAALSARQGKILNEKIKLDTTIGSIITGILTPVSGVEINVSNYMIIGKIIIIGLDLTAVEQISQYQPIAYFNNGGLSGNGYIYTSENGTCYLSKDKQSIDIYKSDGLAPGERIFINDVAILNS